MYYLTIFADGHLLSERLPHQDFADAVAACGSYYEPRAKGSALVFSSVVVGKKFMRSYAQLTRLEDLPQDLDRSSPQALRAVKLQNAFSYSRSYSFLIESEVGALEADRMRGEEINDGPEHS